MALTKKELEMLATTVAQAVVKALKQEGLVGSGTPKNNQTAYSKTVQLLYSYNNFRKTVEQRLQEIEDIKKYGVPTRDGSIITYQPHGGGTVRGIVLPDESVECAVKRVEASMVETLRAIELVDKGLEALRNDPYCGILAMRYFEGQTQEDIAAHFGVSQVTISNNQKRLLRELSMQIFPKQTVEEMIN